MGLPVDSLTAAPANWRVWWLAIRPKTLPAAAAGVIMGGVLAWSEGHWSTMLWLIALSIACLLQIASNLANDVYDAERGTDTADRKGPTRVTQSGLLSARAVKIGMTATLVVALGLGLYLTYRRGWIVLAVGLAAMAAAVLYTGGPFPYGYHGLGDLFVYLFFGQAAVTGTYFVMAGRTTPLAWIMAIPPGLIITALLVVNNLRDIDEDKAAGKKTLTVRIGPLWTKIEYWLCLTIAFLVPPALIVAGYLPLPTLTYLLAAPLAIQVSRGIAVKSGPALNAALAMTARLAFFYSLFFAAGLLAAGLLK